jgi:neutral ceramidase
LFSYAGGKPNLREAREIERLKQGALEAVRSANEHLQPARVAFARGESWININNGEQSGSKEGYDPRGPSDKTLDVVRIDTTEGTPIAVLVNYASHAEVMFRSVTRGDGYEVSGDLPGAVSRILETLPGPEPLVLFTSAAEADQLTLFKSLTYAGRLPAVDEGAAGWALLDVQARRLSDAVLGLITAMPVPTSQVELQTATGSASCPGQRLQIDNQTGRVLVEDKAPVAIPLGVIKINDIVLAGVGGDVATEIGQEFKAASPFAHAILISMTGKSVGHIMTDALYEHPGHGLTKSPLKPHCAEHAVVDGLIHLIKGAT